jgi:hypothetical protein
MQKEKIWTTNQGKMILISKMDDYHLQNSIKMLYNTSKLQAIGEICGSRILGFNL